jgi:putative nucleotidyltransferase with HDIG domain
MIPTREQCIQILSDYCVPPRVRRHCLLVAKVAVRLAEALNSKGYSLNIQVIEAAALLHDIARNKPHHARVGADFLLSKGYNEIAEIVRQHMKPDPGERDRVSEVTVVYIADKYVEDDSIVPLEKRFLKKTKVFHKSPAAIKSIEENYRTALALQDIMEKEIGYQGGLFTFLTRQHNEEGGLPE